MLLDITSPELASLITGILGAAAGVVYIISINIGIKRYPEKKGIVTGFILGASGFGGLCWFRLQDILLTWLSLPNTLLLISSCATVFILAGSFAFIEPHAGYVPPIWKKPKNSLAGLLKAPDDLKEILCRLAFCIIVVSLLLASSAAIFFSGNLQYVCNKILMARGLEVPLAARITLLAVAIFAISDALGRIAWGALADNIGFKLSAVLLCAVETILILLISTFGGSGSVQIFGTFFIGTALGGVLVLYPCIVCEFIDEQDFFKTYSIIFALFLVNASAIIQFSGYLRVNFGANTAIWLNCLFFSSALPLAGGIVLMPLKRPGRRAPKQEREELKNEIMPDEIKPAEEDNDCLKDENKETSRKEDEAIQQNN